MIIASVEQASRYEGEGKDHTARLCTTNTTAGALGALSSATINMPVQMLDLESVGIESEETWASPPAAKAGEIVRIIKFNGLRSV